MFRTQIAVVAVLSIAIGCNRVPDRLRVERMDLPIPSGSIVPQTTMMKTGDIVVSWLRLDGIR